MKYQIYILLVVLVLSGCSSNQLLPSTDAEVKSSYTYIPLDPLSITKQQGSSCPDGINTKLEVKDLLEALPDQTVRIAVKKFSTSGEASFTTFATAAKNESYDIILDYMNTDTAPGTFMVRRIVSDVGTYKAGVLNSTYKRSDYKREQVITPFESTPPSIRTRFEIVPFKADKVYNDSEWHKINIPIYVGLGLRLKASLTALKGNVDLSGLPSIAAQAELGKVRGSLVVQTLGLSGKNVATILPLPSELNETTLTNSLLAMGAIKALIHEEEGVTRTPRVVGFYNPYGGGEGFVNALIDALSESRHPWYQPCKV